MGLNVSTTMGFENRELLRNTAKNILSNSGASEETVSKIIEKNVFDLKSSENIQKAILMASTQITVNKSLTETLKYLKSHSKKDVKKTPVLGELWNIFSANNKASEENPYKGELYNYEIDTNAKNIFAA